MSQTQTRHVLNSSVRTRRRGMPNLETDASPPMQGRILADQPILEKEDKGAILAPVITEEEVCRGLTPYEQDD